MVTITNYVVKNITAEHIADIVLVGLVIVSFIGLIGYAIYLAMKE